MDDIVVNVHNLKLTVKSYPPSVHILFTIPTIENTPPPRPAAEQILEDVAATTGISVDRITSPSREEEVVTVRDRVIWQLWDDLKMTTTGIGRLLNRDHSSISCSLRRTRAAAEISKPPV